jgi:hypothetical protein
VTEAVKLAAWLAGAASGIYLVWWTVDRIGWWK